ncbi:MAG: phage minor capsid protein [Schleiferilactobacillus perolens]|uniref:phage minor capsid protein n=1 Tax=Schleiferilactobacillus perolens TaxID=100468 RepID=UPI0039EC3C18
MSPRVTPHQLDLETSSIIEVYQRLEDNIFAMFVDRLKAKGIYALTHDTALQWQLEKLNELHLINNETIKLIAQATNTAEPLINQLVMDNGIKVIAQVDEQLSSWTNQQPPPPQNLVDTTLKGLLHQTKANLNNNINETLISRNYQGGAAQIFRNIITDAVTQTIIGVITPDKALDQAVYKWADAGIKSGLVNAAGRRMGLEGYARSVITSTAYNTFNQLSIDRAKEYGWHTFVMSTHAAARPACAPIQGRVVINVPREDANPDEGDYPSIYDYGYGLPAGTLGINCRHTLTPFNPATNTNTLHPPDPAEAVANHTIMQQQRALERRVRLYKRKKILADKLMDEDASKHFDVLIKDNQARLRSIVKKHDFLYRDYQREKVIHYTPAQMKEDTPKFASDQYKAFVKKYGPHGLPTADEYQQMVQQGGEELHLFRNYIRAREGRMVEPLADFGLYKQIESSLKRKVDGLVTSSGHRVESHSYHTIDRVIGTRYEQQNRKKKRNGVSIDDIRDVLLHGETILNEKTNIMRYNSDKVEVRLNLKTGKIITVLPK